jgi:hypothetical protein
MVRVSWELFRSMDLRVPTTISVILNPSSPTIANKPDLGVYPINDWYSHETDFQFLANSQVTLQEGVAPESPDNLLINGTNTNANGGGSLSHVTLTPNKKHRLRIINTSTESGIWVTMDNHPFQVIASDFVPIKPFTVCLAATVLNPSTNKHRQTHSLWQLVNVTM